MDISRLFGLIPSLEMLLQKMWEVVEEVVGDEVDDWGNLVVWIA